MHLTVRLTAAAALALAIAAPASAQPREFPATLAGHALIPAQRMILPPDDAPPAFRVSGRFTGTGNLRTDAIASIPQRTGIALPFVGQPLQGFSGIKPVGDGSYWVLTDNGFGSRRNSPDALLFVSRIRPDWKHGGVAILEHVFLSDPTRVVPFKIENEHTRERYLTGADFDPESLQPVADGFWIGEEFGPFLLHVDRQGRVTGVYPTTSGGRELRSPDHPALQLPASPTQAVPFQVQRSGGFEGMALSPDGSTLYALLEKPLLDEAGRPETVDGRRVLRILEFSVARRAWTGRELRFPLDEGATAIGDFNMVDARRALIIERDDGEGDPSMACAPGTQASPQNRCFPTPALLKRVVLVDLQDADPRGLVRRIGHIDLMAIRDPDNRALLKGEARRDLAGTFTFPFFTIENVAAVDAEHIVVGVDNNLPFSVGRWIDRAVDNELILLRVPELLQAR
jgi:hypothetical protein